MNVARAKLDLIKPEEVSMDEYEVSRGVLSSFNMKRVAGASKSEWKYAVWTLDSRIVLYAWSLSLKVHQSTCIT